MKNCTPPDSTLSHTIRTHLVEVEGPRTDEGLSDDVGVQRLVAKRPGNSEAALYSPPQHAATCACHPLDFRGADLQRGTGRAGRKSAEHVLRVPHKLQEKLRVEHTALSTLSPSCFQRGRPAEGDGEGGKKEC